MVAFLHSGPLCPINIRRLPMTIRVPEKGPSIGELTTSTPLLQQGRGSSSTASSRKTSKSSMPMRSLGFRLMLQIKRSPKLTVRKHDKLTLTKAVLAKSSSFLWSILR